MTGANVSGRELENISKYLDIVRNRAGIEWYAESDSHHFVTTAAVLASSVSAYADLAAACK
ncbi:diphosphomevalonate decarboxylase, partial [Staphylococcus aureus]